MEPTKTFIEMAKEMETLQKRAEERRALEKQQILPQIREQIVLYGITKDELFSRPGPKRSK